MEFLKEKNKDTGYPVTCINCKKEFIFEGEPYCTHCNQEQYPIYFAQKNYIRTGFSSFNAIEEYQYIKKPEAISETKKNKKVKIFGKELKLTDKERKFAILYLAFMKAANECASDIRNQDFEVITGRISIDVKKAYRRVGQFAYELVSFFNDYTNVMLSNEILAFMGGHMELLQEFVKTQKEIDDYYINQIHSATNTLRGSMTSIQAKAIGRETGILCASDSLFMASVGTYATKAILEDESNKALSSHSAALTNITDERTEVFIGVFHTIMKQAILNCLTLFFSRDFGEDEILKLTSLLCKNFKELNNKEIFLEYPFLHTTHIEIIKDLKEDDIKAFAEILEYYNIKEYDKTMLENLANSSINDKIGNIKELNHKFTYEEFKDNTYLKLLIQLFDIDEKSFINNNVCSLIRSFISTKNAEMGLFNKKKIRNEIEEKISLFDSILTSSEIEMLKINIK